MASSQDAAKTSYDLDAFRRENGGIRDLLSHVRYDVSSCDSMMEGDLDPQLAARLSRDVERMVGMFLHYSRKEQLVLPHLERHEDDRGPAQDAQEHEAADGTDPVTSAWEGDNGVRGIVAMAASLMSGATQRPSAGNLQSVASQLAEACDAAERIADDEEASLVPLMRERLDAADWQAIAEDAPGVRVPVADDGSTWGPGPLDMAEARLRAATCGQRHPA